MTGATTGGGLPLRAIVRVVDQWVYELTRKWFSYFDGDTRLSAICLFTHLANTEYILADPVLSARFRDSHVVREHCRPVRVASIALALNIDAETTRRKIGLLTRRGLATADACGVIVHMDDLKTGDIRHEYENLSARLTGLVADLRRLVLDHPDDAGAMAPLAGLLEIDPAWATGNFNLISIVIAKFISRTLVEGSLIFKSDRDMAATLFSIHVENKRPITSDRALSRTYAWLETPTPQAEKRPVSGNFVARQIGLPAQTVRRKVKRLEMLGIVQRTSRGLLVVNMPMVRNAQATVVYNHLVNMLKSIKNLESPAAAA